MAKKESFYRKIEEINLSTPEGKKRFGELLSERDKAVAREVRFKDSKVMKRFLKSFAEKGAEVKKAQDTAKTAGEVANRAVLVERKLTELQLLSAELQREKDELKKQLEIEKYRTKRLLEEGDKVIPELVMGNSIEEIEQSIETSKQRLEQIKKEVKRMPNIGRQMEEIDRETETGRRSEAKSLDAAAVRNMSLEEYLKNRDAVLRGAEEAFQKAFGPGKGEVSNG